VRSVRYIVMAAAFGLFLELLDGRSWESAALAGAAFGLLIAGFEAIRARFAKPSE
jgi:small-conductance mechanosensitive channel